jgi:hypothetical protein
MHPPRRIIQHIERTEGMKFKKIPTVKYGVAPPTSRGHNDVLIEVDKAGKDANIVEASVLIGSRYKRPVEDRQHRFSIHGTDKLVLMHELRENLLFQNKPEITSKQAHTRTMKKTQQDIDWLKEKGFIKYGKPNKKSRFFF